MTEKTHRAIFYAGRASWWKVGTYLMDPQYDLADDAYWDPFLAHVLANEFSGILASPPCNTYSRLRNKLGGPPPPRGIVGRDRYGLKRLCISDKGLVRLHNLISLRVAAVLQHVPDNDG